MIARSYLYRCYICGKEQIYRFSGDPPLIVCDDRSHGNVAMELVKEVEE